VISYSVLVVLFIAFSIMFNDVFWIAFALFCVFIGLVENSFKVNEKREYILASFKAAIQHAEEFAAIYEE
jgi:hypothetical protein